MVGGAQTATRQGASCVTALRSTDPGMSERVHWRIKDCRAESNSLSALQDSRYAFQLAVAQESVCRSLVPVGEREIVLDALAFGLRRGIAGVEPRKRSSERRRAPRRRPIPSRAIPWPGTRTEQFHVHAGDRAVDRLFVSYN